MLLIEDIADGDFDLDLLKFRGACTVACALLDKLLAPLAERRRQGFSIETTVIGQPDYAEHYRNRRHGIYRGKPGLIRPCRTGPEQMRRPRRDRPHPGDRGRRLVGTSSQIGLDPKTGQLVAGRCPSATNLEGPRRRLHLDGSQGQPTWNFGDFNSEP